MFWVFILPLRQSYLSLILCAFLRGLEWFCLSRKTIPRGSTHGKTKCGLRKALNMAERNEGGIREFSTDLSLYEKGRPEYTKESVEFLLCQVGLLSKITKERTTLLEIGAGTGKFTRAMVEVLTSRNASVEITASDPKPEMCEAFRRLVPGIKMLQFPAEDIGELCEAHVTPVFI